MACRVQGVGPREFVLVVAILEPFARHLRTRDARSHRCKISHGWLRLWSSESDYLLPGTSKGLQEKRASSQRCRRACPSWMCTEGRAINLIWVSEYDAVKLPTCRRNQNWQTELEEGGAKHRCGRGGRHWADLLRTSTEPGKGTGFNVEG